MVFESPEASVEFRNGFRPWSYRLVRFGSTVSQKNEPTQLPCLEVHRLHNHRVTSSSIFHRTKSCKSPELCPSTTLPHSLVFRSAAAPALLLTKLNRRRFVERNGTLTDRIIDFVGGSPFNPPSCGGGGYRCFGSRSARPLVDTAHSLLSWPIVFPPTDKL